ncbi:MAG: type II toxin-antitoxin system HicB family antitoxin [Deltaproteobacteria bacterium]|nr:type II toxin-antitoxin system HicB family antitoxin [Deltaproteobacteria bacterium]
MIPDGYRILMHYDDDRQKFVIRVPEIDLQASAATRTEALAQVEEAIEARIRKAAEDGSSLPQPVDGTEFDGQLQLSISPGLHRELVFLATTDGVELEKLAAEMISEGVGRRSFSAARGEDRGERRSERSERSGGGRRRGGGRNKKDYHNIMDDRASFIEYVRGIEAGGRGGRGRNRGRKK